MSPIADQIGRSDLLFLYFSNITSSAPLLTSPDSWMVRRDLHVASQMFWSLEKTRAASAVVQQCSIGRYNKTDRSANLACLMISINNAEWLLSPSPVSVSPSDWLSKRRKNKPHFWQLLLFKGIEYYSISSFIPSPKSCSCIEYEHICRISDNSRLQHRIWADIRSSSALPMLIIQFLNS